MNTKATEQVVSDILKESSKLELAKNLLKLETFTSFKLVRVKGKTSRASIDVGSLRSLIIRQLVETLESEEANAKS